MSRNHLWILNVAFLADVGAHVSKECGRRIQRFIWTTRGTHLPGDVLEEESNFLRMLLMILLTPRASGEPWSPTVLGDPGRLIGTLGYVLVGFWPRNWPQNRENDRGMPGSRF